MAWKAEPVAIALISVVIIAVSKMQNKVSGNDLKPCFKIERKIIMYFIPGFVTVRYDNELAYLTSRMLHNEVCISEPQYLDELKCILKEGCDELSTPLRQFLHDQELLQNNQEVQDNLELYKKLLNRNLMITLMPTETCNFRCPYCYEDHSSTTMNNTIIEAIKNHVEQQIKKFKVLQVNWFGGEPTLCKDIILNMGHFFKALTKYYSVDYFATMTTNGYLLSVNDFKKYYDTGIVSYQITLDGWNHDKTRPHVSGKGTFETIINNLKQISELPKEEYNFKIILRHNILAGDDDFSWYDFLKKLFGTDDRFTVLVRPVGNWGGDTVQSLSLLKINDSDSAVKSHIDYIKKIGLKHDNGTHKRPFSQVCYANYPNSAVFRADGRIEKCTVCLDHPQNNVGYIDEKSEVIWNPEIENLWTESKFEEKCFKCPSILVCMNMRCRKGIITEGKDYNTCTKILSEIY